MNITFYERYRQDVGYAVLSPDGVQEREIHHCKEVFARRMRDIPKRGPVIHFLRKENAKKDLYDPKQQEKVLHVFERAMGIEPLGKVEYVTNVRQVVAYDNAMRSVRRNETDYFLLYTVSQKWADSLPLSHILALITRNQYPKDRPMGWKSILKWLHEPQGFGDDVKETVREIIEAGGKVNKRVKNNGIDDYAHNLTAMRARAAARKAEKLRREENAG